MTTSPRRRKPQADPQIPESVWQQRVLEIARLHGWNLAYHTFDSRRSTQGFPDLVLVHERRLRALHVELKSNTGQPSSAQRRWLIALARSGLEVALWRPSDLQEVLRVLGQANVRSRLNLAPPLPSPAA